MSIKVTREGCPTPIKLIDVVSKSLPDRHLTAKLVNRLVFFYYERDASARERTVASGEKVAGDMGITADEAREFAALLCELADQADA